MSRIGKLPVQIPSGVTVTVDGTLVRVKGPKGELSQQFPAEMAINVDGAELKVTRPSEEKRVRALHGLTRSLINNMVNGVSTGFEKRLEIVGVGYRAEANAKGVKLIVGYSHPVEYVAPEGIKIQVEGNVVIVQGIDRQVVGQVAAEIRKVRPPEPYKGKGIRYLGEQVRTKAGKTGT